MSSKVAVALASLQAIPLHKNNDTLAHDNDTGDIFFLSRSEEAFYFRFRLRHFEIRGPLMSDDVGSVTTS